jgi:hypothetical protein
MHAVLKTHTGTALASGSPALLCLPTRWSQRKSTRCSKVLCSQLNRLSVGTQQEAAEQHETGVLL